MRSWILILTLSGALLSTSALAHDIFGCMANGQMSYVNTSKELATRRAAGETCRLIQRVKTPLPDKESVPRAVRPASHKRRGGTRAVFSDKGSMQDRAQRYVGYVDDASSKYKIPQAFLRAVMRVESAFRFDAVSSKGAQGLMQLMPATARSMGVADSFDPQQNIMGGAKLIRVLANKYDGDMVKVLSAYHAGAGNVAKKGGIPFGATEGYVRAVLDHYYRYKASGS